MRSLLSIVLAAALVGAVLGTSGCRAKPQPAKLAEQVTTATPSPSSVPSSATAAIPSAVQPVEPHLNQAAASVYFLSDEKVAAASRVLKAPAVAESALKALLAGPTPTEKDQGLSSAIPAGTSLRSVKITDGTAAVDLSKAFGSGGGSLSMTARVAQVVFTLTQFASVQRVSFHIDGEPVEALGGEGLILVEPQTRADFEDLSPAVLLERPAWGGTITIGTIAEFRGSANVFEASFNLELTDGDGRIVAKRLVTATSGTGTRGTFRARMAMPADAHSGWGSVIAWYASPKDGKRVVVAEVPVRVTSGDSP